MNSDWEIIGEKVFSFYEEMKYRSESSEYTFERFKADFEIEKKIDLALGYANVDEENDVLCWISHFRKLLDRRRSILTKLFRFGNNLHGVDTLVEFCDYYTTYFIENDNFSFSVIRLIHYICGCLAMNKTTDIRLYDDVWCMLQHDIRGAVSGPGGSFLDFYSNDQFGTVIMADSDLNAAIQALVTSRNSYFGVSRVLIQEPVKEKLLDIIHDNEYKTEILANLIVFRNVGEALVDLNGLKNFQAISVWSENIIAAKKFAADLEIGTIWINTHGDLSPGLRSILHILPFIRLNFCKLCRNTKKQDTLSQTLPKIVKTIDLFYGGKWELPTKGEYWIDQSGISFARATEKDFDKCVTTARKAFKSWRVRKLSQRAKVIKCFAERFRAHGQSEYADIVSLWANPQFLEHGNSLSIARDGEVEITSTLRPVGVIAIYPCTQSMLLKNLTIATLIGNTVVIVINSQNTEVSFASYCEMLASSGFPPGVVNYLFTTNDKPSLKLDNTIFDGKLDCTTDGFKKINETLVFITKPKSVWLQCS